MTGPPDRERASKSTSSDEFVERLADRIDVPKPPLDVPKPAALQIPRPAPPLPPDQTELPPADSEETSDVHALGAVSFEDEALEIPPDAKSDSSVDAFAEFEDDFEGETTRIDDSHLIAEESTSILEAAPAQPFLSVERGKDMGREFVIQEGENGVGRGIDNDVILADVAVSRRHLKIVREGDQLTMRDLGSGNGTLVNGSRVSNVVLADGDRIELGETTLVVRLPGADLMAEDPFLPAGEATDEQNIGSGIPMPGQFGTPSDPMAIPNGPGYQPELTPSATAAPVAPVAPRGAIVLPRRVFIALIAGGAMTLALFGAVVAALVIHAASSDDEPTATVGATSHYALGLRAYQANRWADAEREFRAALEDPDPPEDQDAAEVQGYLERTALAVRDQPVIDRARELQRNGDLPGASREAASVRSAESPLFPTAQRLLGEIRQDQAAAAVAAGREALRRGDLDEARRQLGLATGFDPSGASVAAFRTELTSASGTGPAPTDPAADATEPEATEPEVTAPEVTAPEATPEPEAVVQPDEDDPTPAQQATARRGRSSGRTAGTSLPQRIAPRRGASTSSGSGITRTVIQYYLGGDFERAANTADLASRTATGAEQRTLRSLAENIRAFGRLWPQITRANFGASVRRQMSQAMALDARIANNPRYRSQLSSHLVQLHLQDAQRQRANPVNQCRAVQTAYRIDPDHPDVTRMVGSCETIARGMLSGAANAPVARRSALYDQIITMVPPSSAIARDARRLRDELRRGTSLDEDE
ncbi:MAG: FHA domain-containing protein [Myxococcales bacterium]|nr:FHA domain-containing protein [Myxococcales bacterium]